MERFIGKFYTLSATYIAEFKIQYGEIYSLNHCLRHQVCKHLKSSMERFIGFFHYAATSSVGRFKIQYGEIYSFQKGVEQIWQKYLKSSMERFIVCVEL